MVVDSLEDTLIQIQEDPKLFFDENFMIGIFSDIEDKVQQLKEYLLYLFEKKKMTQVVENRNNFRTFGCVQNFFNLETIQTIVRTRLCLT